MQVISVRENISYKEKVINYLQQSWDSVDPMIYKDCIEHCIHSSSLLPQWYVLLKDDEIIGCAGLITNDFISRMDLYPWLAALFIEEEFRGNNYASLLINRAKEDTKKMGFKHLYLCTELNDYYEKLGFSYIGDGYHPWEEQSKIYEIEL